MAFHAGTVAGATVRSREWLASDLETPGKAVRQEFILRADRHAERHVPPGPAACSMND